MIRWPGKMKAKAGPSNSRNGLRTSMPRSIRFHLDEHVAHPIADGLRRRGADVTTTTDAGLLGASDPEQLAHARTAGRVFFTEDHDFLALARGAEHYLTPLGFHTFGPPPSVPTKSTLSGIECKHGFLHSLDRQ